MPSTVPTPVPSSEPRRPADPPRAQSHPVRLGAGLQIAVAAFAAFAMIEIAQVAMNAVRRPHPVTVRTVAANLAERAQAAAAARPAAPTAPAARQTMDGVRSVALLALALAMGALAFRVLLRSAALTTGGSTPEAAATPGLAGACYHACALAGLTCLLAWAASAAKTPSSSDGMVAGLLGSWLLAAAFVSLLAFIGQGRAFPHYFGQFINDAVFGAAILAYLHFYERVPLPFSRASAVAVALLLNSALDFALSARFVLRNRAAGGLFRRGAAFVTGVALVAAVAWTLAVFDKPGPAQAQAAPKPPACAPAR